MPAREAVNEIGIALRAVALRVVTYAYVYVW